MVEHYDIIAFGTGSAMNIVSQLYSMGHRPRVAVIENNMVGGICLTRGCIPSKLILYPAVMVRRILESRKLGLDVQIKSIDFTGIMERAYQTIYRESKEIEQSLKEHPLIDLYQVDGTFVGDYTVDVGGREIEAETILLCTGSKPRIINVPGLEEVKYYTNENFFREIR
ncbi:MAG: dihydrolipoyl dehydrogenase, partial [Thermoprotei archaeon]